MANSGEATEELYYYLARGEPNISTVSKLLSQGADANVRLTAGISMLDMAITKVSPEAAKTLIKHGAKINDSDSRGYTALHKASGDDSRSAGTQIIPFLISEGADLEARDNDGKTPLLTAALYGLASNMQQLIDGGANVRAANKNGVTAAHFIADAGNKSGALDILKLLQEKGADLAARDQDGKSPLDYAKDNGVSNLDVIKILTDAETSKQAYFDKILAAGPSTSSSNLVDSNFRLPNATQFIDRSARGLS